jgi:hypothetical protein
MKFARLLLVPFLSLLFVAGAKKQPISVRFHVEANARDGETFAMPVKFQNPPREGYVERVPTLSERDVSEVKPFQVGDGTFACAFMLNAHGRTSLQTLSTEKRGSSMVIYVSTKGGTHQVIDLLIDKPITDGIIYVPRGLTGLEVAALHKQFDKKVKKKKEAPASPAPV